MTGRISGFLLLNAGLMGSTRREAVKPWPVVEAIVAGDSMSRGGELNIFCVAVILLPYVIRCGLL